MQCLWRTLDLKTRSSPFLAPTTLATTVQVVQEVPADQTESTEELPAPLSALPLSSLRHQGGGAEIDRLYGKGYNAWESLLSSVLDG